jgi:hypothetical protein
MEDWLRLKVKFFSYKNGGRITLSENMLSTRLYRPHLVVGDPNQKHTKYSEKHSCIENYLGVVFIEQSDKLVADKEILVTVLKPYEGVDYSELVSGVTFTIREGGKVVGNGIVL